MRAGTAREIRLTGALGWKIRSPAPLDVRAGRRGQSVTHLLALVVRMELVPGVTRLRSLAGRASLAARAVICCSVGLWLGACRMDNPAFNNNAGGEGTEPNPATTQGPGPGPDATGTEKGEETGVDPDATSSSGPGPESSSGPGPDTGVDPMPQPDKAAQAFCEQAPICFPIHRLDPGGIVQDLGPGALTINFEQPVNLERNWADPPPLDHTIRLNPGSAGNLSSPLVWMQKREVGFDIWFAPEDVNANNWTLFEIDDLLAVERLRTGGLRCTAKKGLVDVGPVVVNPAFEPGKLYHVACGIVGDRLKMWWNSAPISYGIPVVTGEETSFQMRLGASTQDQREAFLGRVASLRVWSSVEEMRVKNGFPE